MVDRICVVLEALSIAVCLHRLYGKKFRFDIATASLMTVEMIMMQAIDYFGWPKELSMLFAPVVVIYCIIEFGFDLKILINNVLLIVILSILQITVMVLFYLLDSHNTIVGMRLLFSNAIVLLIIVVILPRLKMKFLTDLLNDKEIVLIISIIICIAITIYGLINFKKINFLNHLDWFQNIVFSVCVIMIGILAIKLGRYKVKSKEIETELKMHKLYADSFDNLIDNIRSRQHEFDNHINTIYSQHYIYHTYNELVDAQRNYCQIVTTENRFNKLLSSGNPVISGFLYGKFVEIDKYGIKVSYHVSIKELQICIPVYKLVEILGNLVNNAVEALLNCKKYKQMYVHVEENDEHIDIEVRNESDFISYVEIESFFIKGYSKKGDGRGLGLFHVKNICNEYKLNLLCQNKEIEGINWLSFTISNKKETI